MLIVSEIRAELHRRAHELIPGRYSTFDELVNVALENQLNLERQRSGHALDPDKPLGAPPREQTVNESEGSASVPGVHSLEAVDVTPVPPPDSDIWAFPVLWGQVNRLLPVAAAVRVLGHVLAEQGEREVPIAMWHDRSWQAATVLHSYTAELDLRARRKRGDLWVTGFPKGDRGSIRRYVSQFLGRGNTKSPGGAEVLGLVRSRGEGERTLVGITPAGVRWSSLKNPVFDSVQPRETFSLEEVEVYLDILEKQLPREREFMSATADLINRTESRTDLNDALAHRYPEWEKYISTMRAGAIGRLHDLGLLERTREGTAVRYGLSGRAEEVSLLKTPR